MQVNLNYRDTLSTNQNFDLICNSSWVGSWRGSGNSKFNQSEKTITIYSTGKILDDTGINFPYRAIKNHKYKLTADVKTSGHARGLIGYCGWYNTPITSPDTINFIPIELTVEISENDPKWDYDSGYWFFSLAMVNDSTDTPQFATFKNVEIIDVTASSVEWNMTPETPFISYENGYLISNHESGNQWYYNDTLIIYATSQSYLPTKTGNYTVTSSNETCTSNFSDPYKFTLTSIPEFEDAEGIKVFPNPSAGLFKIDGLPTNQQNNISVYSVDGRLIRKLISNSSTETIDLSSQSSGMYMLFINNQPYKIIKREH